MCQANLIIAFWSVVQNCPTGFRVVICENLRDQTVI